MPLSIAIYFVPFAVSFTPVVEYYGLSAGLLLFFGRVTLVMTAEDQVGVSKACGIVTCGDHIGCVLKLYPVRAINGTRSWNPEVNGPRKLTSLGFWNKSFLYYAATDTAAEWASKRGLKKHY